MKVNKIVKTLLAVSAMSLLAVGLTGCGKKGNAESSDPKTLTVQFVPSVNAGSMDTKIKPLQSLLSKQLHMPVKMTVATNTNTMVEALGSKTLDVGFLPSAAYVLAHKQYGVVPLLQAQRQTRDANEGFTKKLTNHYYSEIVVRKDSNIKSLKDLKGKKIATQDTTSAAGYIYPAVEMQHEGVNLNKDCKPFTVKGSDQGVMSVVNGNADAAFVFEGARSIAAKDDPKAMTDTRVLYKSTPIPNDTISARKGLSPKLDKKIQKAFIDISKTKHGREVLFNIYQHNGYIKTSNKDFAPMKSYIKQANDLNKNK